MKAGTKPIEFPEHHFGPSHTCPPYPKAMAVHVWSQVAGSQEEANGTTYPLSHGHRDIYFAIYLELTDSIRGLDWYECSNTPCILYRYMNYFCQLLPSYDPPGSIRLDWAH